MTKYRFIDCVDLVGEACKKYEGEKKYISTGTVNNDYISEKDVEFVSYNNKPSRANLSVKVGDILFAKMKETQKTLLIDKEKGSYIYSTGFCAIHPKEKVITERCLYHLIRSNAFLSQKDKYRSGATQKAITNEGLKKIMINIPSLNEQLNIANQLDLLSLIIKQRKNQLQKLDELIKDRFVEIFGEPETNPYGWEQLTVGDVCKSIIRGPFGSSLKKEFFVPSGDTTYKVYEQKHAIQKSSDIGTYYITSEKFSELKRFECHSGDILMSCSGTMGELYQLPSNCERGIINQTFSSLRLTREFYRLYF